MDYSVPLNTSALWLNEHAFIVVIAMASIALIAEATKHLGSRDAATVAKSAWFRTWLTNLGLLVCALVVTWVLAPWISPAFSVALSGQTGLLVWLEVPTNTYAGYVFLGVLLLDLLTYGLHRLFHKLPILWRLHQVHHSDSAVNASTHFRQHPAQDFVIPLMQLPVLWLLGISGVSWVLYAALSTGAQVWQHSENCRSARVDRWLGVALITPLAHLTHHDQRQQFHDQNYGAIFSVWDRLFGTYVASPAKFQLGLPHLPSSTRTTKLVSFMDCLRMPFRSTASPSESSAPTPFHTHFQGKK